MIKMLQVKSDLSVKKIIGSFFSILLMMNNGFAETNIRHFRNIRAVEKSCKGLNKSFSIYRSDTTMPEKRTAYEVVMFGNSIIENGADWNKWLQRGDVKNSGHGGFTTSHFVWLLFNDVIAYKPKICFLEGGINDIGVGIPVKRIKRNYRQMVDSLLANNIKPVLVQIVYVNQNDENENKKKAQAIDIINSYLNKLAQNKNIDIINLNQHLSKNKRIKKPFTTDGVHFTDSAYEIFANEVNNILKKNGI